MKKWSERPKEIAFLFNPAFCGAILFNTIKTYQAKTSNAFPFPLIYLVLPLIINKRIREKISPRNKFHVWVQNNVDLLINFGKSTRDFVQLTNEAIEFLLQTKKISINEEGKLEANEKENLKKIIINEEITDCLKKTETISKWFASQTKIEMVYIILGVRP